MNASHPLPPLERYRRVLVLGAGVMGRGIALVSIRAGFDTWLYDPASAAREAARDYIHRFLEQSVAKGKLSDAESEAALRRLALLPRLQDVEADLIIEAAPERLEVKLQILQEATSVLSDWGILASNTSTLPITRLAAALPDPGRFGGMHFFNPAPLMKLVEIIPGQRTRPDVGERLSALAVAMGKEPIAVADSPGFIVNRVARAYYLESLRLLEEGAVSVEGMDRLMRGLGFAMGPFELMDLIGVDTNHAVSASMFQHFFQEERFRPSRIQQQMCDAGFHGRKSGQGFYAYPPPGAD